MVRLPVDDSTQAFSADTFPHFAACFVTIGVMLALIGCLVSILTTTAIGRVPGPNSGQVNASHAATIPAASGMKAPAKTRARNSLSPEAFVLFLTPWVLLVIVSALFVGAAPPKRRD